MPAAIPLAVMAAGTVASKVGEHKAAQKRNKAQEEINQRNIGVGDKAMSYIDEDRSMYKGLLNGVNSGQYDFNPITVDPTLTPARMNESQDFYRNAMGTGLYTQADMNDFRNRQALGNTATFEAVRRGLNENSAIRGGGYSGYNNQLARLARDQARQLEEGRLGAETTLQENIRGNKFKGAEGVQANDRDYTGQLRANTDILNQFAAMNNDTTNKYGAMNAENRYSRPLGLMGAMSNATQGYLGTAGQNYRVNAPEEIQPWWGTLGAGAAQAAGSYLGSTGAQKRVNKIPSTKYNFNQVGG